MERSWAQLQKCHNPTEAFISVTSLDNASLERCYTPKKQGNGKTQTITLQNMTPLFTTTKMQNLLDITLILKFPHYLQLFELLMLFIYDLLINKLFKPASMEAFQLQKREFLCDM